MFIFATEFIEVTQTVINQVKQLIRETIQL